MELKSGAKNSGFTRRQLKIAARREFNSSGYFATDSNKIARLAGYAPGSFYRYFKDKLEIFIEVFRDWHWEQVQEIQRSLSLGGSHEEMSQRMSELILRFYTHWRTFRASARVLALSEPRVDEFKRLRREELVARVTELRTRLRLPVMEIKDIVTFLIVLERLADAVMDGEYERFGLNAEESKAELTAFIRTFFTHASVR